MGKRLKDLDDQWLLRTHFFGLYKIRDDGTFYLPNPVNDTEELPPDVLVDAIEAAIDRLEKLILAKIAKKEQITEWHDYDMDVAAEYHYVSLRNYPVNTVHSVEFVYGQHGDTLWSVPDEYVQTYGRSKFGSIHIFPRLGASLGSTFDPATLSFFNYSIGSRGYGPCVIKVVYDAGMDGETNVEGGLKDLDNSVVRAIGLMAAIHPLNIIGDLIIGAGISNISSSFDNISVSVGTTASAENAAMSARIIMHRRELYGEHGVPGLVDNLKTSWRPIPVGLL